MKLLKYPLIEHNKTVTAMAGVQEKLLLADREGHVHIWPQQSLSEAAFDGSKIKHLAADLAFEVEFETGELDRTIVFMAGTEKSLFIGTEHRVMRIETWMKHPRGSINTVLRTQSPTMITDMKLDVSSGVLFVLTVDENAVHLIDANTLEKLGKIELPGIVRPITGVVDPVGQVFTVLASDRSMIVYQYNKTGAFKVLHKFPQYVKLDPLRYKINMPPQADTLPVINTVKGNSGSSSSTIQLLDRNNNFHVASTLVSPPVNECQILKFSPKVYVKMKKGIRNEYNLLATSGSNQGSVVVWNTKRTKPLFGALQVSETPVLDMIWSADGLKLFAISDDNVLYSFVFQESDLGDIVPQEEVDVILQKIKPLASLPVSKVSDEVSKSTVVKAEEGDAQLIQNIDTPKALPKKNGKKRVESQVAKKTQGTSMEFNAPSYSVPKDLKRKLKTDVNKDANGTKKQKKDLEPIDFLDTSLLWPLVAFSKVRLATPKIRLSFTYRPPQDRHFTLEVKNGSGNEQKPTIVKLLSKLEEGEKTLFQDLIPKFVTMCTSGSNFWACCTNDGLIYVYSDTGQKLLPPLCLGVPCSFLEACSSYLLCLTSMGQLYCWDIESKKLHFPVNTVFPLLNPTLRYSDDILTRAENITICAVTSKGVPLATLSNGDGFMFDKDMETWLLISDGWWAYGSQYWDMTNSNSLQGSLSAEDGRDKLWNSSDAHQLASIVRDDKKSLVNFMERKTNDELSRKGRIKNLQRFARTILMKEGFENMEEIVTLSHLENRLLVTLRLEENKEFSKLLIIYCIRLSELGYTDRLSDVLQWLYNDGDFEVTKLAGRPRKEHLKDVLIACADIRHVQRVTNGYASALGLLNESP